MQGEYDEIDRIDVAWLVTAGGLRHAREDRVAESELEMGRVSPLASALELALEMALEMMLALEMASALALVWVLSG